MDAQNNQAADRAVVPRSRGSNLTNISITFVFGAPGAGKGTLCKALASKINAFHFSVGDYLRDLITDSSLNQNPAALGGLKVEKLREIMDKRDLVYANTIVPIVKHKLESEHARGWTAFLIDGFPRDLEAAEIFEAKVGRPDCVLYFNCPKEVAQSRFLDRKRSQDDNEAVYAKRYDRFMANTPVLLERYGELVKKIDTSGETEASKRSLFEALSLSFENEL